LLSRELKHFLVFASVQTGYTIIPMTPSDSTYIDAKGLNCPMPLMLLKKAMQDIPAGESVIIDVTDEHAELDFEIWCERFGHALEKIREQQSVATFAVTKSGQNN
jgi:tRNA 2-thiouridine synthesizing protein A